MRLLTTAFPERAQLWTIALAVLACTSLAVGNLAALVQRTSSACSRTRRSRRRASCSSPIAVGNALGGRALLYYLISYAAMTIGAFAVVAARERELGEPVTLDNMAGLRLGAAVYRRGDVDVHARLRRTAADRRLHRRSSTPSRPPYDRGWVWLARRRRRSRRRSASTTTSASSGRCTCGPRRSSSSRPSGGSPPPERLVQAAVAGALVVPWARSSRYSR